METVPKQVLDFVIKYVDYKGELKKKHIRNGSNLDLMTMQHWLSLNPQ